MEEPLRVTAVVVSYGEEPWLELSVRAALNSEGVEVDVVLVDNGTTDGGVEAVRPLASVTVVEPGTNTGFAGGCNLGAGLATAPVIAFINPDAIVEPDAIRELASAVLDPTVGAATANIRLADQPELVNSAGNEIHYLGASWAGGFGEPSADHEKARTVAAASGAAMAMRTDSWIELGGFCEAFFAYYEDADLSLRCYQRGLSVEYVPTAVVRHRYSFGRHRIKYFLAERNRVAMVLTLYERRTLMLLAPMLVAFEIALWAMAIGQGWGREKYRATRWLLSNRDWIRRRRRECQQDRSVDDRQLAWVFSARLDPANFAIPRWLQPLQTCLEVYWRGVRKLL